jgi:HK97 family phage prohead protease
MATRLLRALQITVGKRTGEERRWPCTISTEAEVVRRDKSGDEFIEILDHSPESIDFSRGKLPVLEAHDTEKVNIGVVENLHLEGRTLKGDLVLGSSRRADELTPDIDAGIVSGLSVGYLAIKAKRERRADGPTVVRVVLWQPYEVSLTGVPLDIDAGIGRARNKNMSASTQQRAEGDASEAAPVTTSATVTTTVAETRELTCEDIDPEEDPALFEEYGCGENGGKPEGEASESRALRSGDCECKGGKRGGSGGAAPAEARVVDPAQVRALERKRIETINRNVELAGLGRDFAADLIKRDLSVESAGKAIFLALEKRDMDTHGKRRTVGGQVEAGADPRDHFRSGVMNALGDRIKVATLDDNGRRFRSRRVADLCRASLVASGARQSVVDFFSDEQVVMAAMGSRDLMGRAGMVSTSDLPFIFGELSNVSLRKGYGEAPQTFDPLVTRVTLPNLTHERKLLQLSEGPELLEVVEGALYEGSSLTESKITWKLTKYGRTFLITWEALLADNLDAIGRLPAQFGAAARRKESEIVWAQLTSNPTMAYDSVALFHANHGNYDASGAALANDKIAAGRKKIRVQTGLDGTTKLDLMPKFLIVPAALEFTAMTLLAPVAAAQASNVNLYAGQFTLIVEPRLDDNDTDAWYLACDSSQIDMIEFGTLEGYAGPTMFSEEAFDSDGHKLKARHVFGAKVVDHRGFYKSAGA